MLEIIIQILWFIIAGWLIRRAYLANKKAEPFSFRDLFNERKTPAGMDSMLEARGFVLGIAMIALLLFKLLNCGFVCGWV